MSNEGMKIFFLSLILGRFTQFIAAEKLTNLQLIYDRLPFDFSRNAQSWQSWHFSSTSSVNELEIGTS